MNIRLKIGEFASGMPEQWESDPVIFATETPRRELLMKIAKVSRLSLAVVAFVAFAVTTEAQTTKRLPRIGVLRGGAPPDPRIDAFRKGLRDLGWVDGENIVLEYRWARGRPNQLRKLAAQLVRLKVDVILVNGNRGTTAAKKATRSIPIVVARTGDLVGAGHAASLARPGGNITGLVTISPRLSTRRLELLKNAVPGIFHVAVLWNVANQAKVQEFKYTQIAADALGLRLQSVEMRKRGDLEQALATIKREDIDALVLLPEFITNSGASHIADFTLKKSLPAIHQWYKFVKAGGLMAYGPDDFELHRRAATYVDKILKGANAGDLPIEEPTKFKLVVNLKTAKQFGLTIPPSVLYQADEVIR